MLRISIFLIILWGLAPSTAFAVVPEGLEALIQDDTPASGSGTGYLTVQGGYVKPNWTHDYETIQGYASLPTSSRNYFTFGAELTVGNIFADRDIYFLRYDQSFWGQSISLKFAHEDLQYAQAGKNIFSLDYNTSFDTGTFVSFYLAAGVYYRFNLNSWNTPTWNPFNWNTDDRDSFFEICLGSKIKFTPKAFLTVDLNNRDPFLPYNADDLAVDFTFSVITVNNLTWRITESTRFSGLLVGTGDLSEVKVLMGLIANL